MTIFRLAVLGAPGTGKTRLAHKLSARASSAAGKVTLLIDDNPELLTALPPGTAAPASLLLSHDLVLLMGLDVGSPGEPARQSKVDADHAIRNALRQRGIGFKVVYGQGDDRLKNALRAMPNDLQDALGNAGPRPAMADATGAGTRMGMGMQQSPRWVWTCDKCSDPVCEHQLFTRLQAARAT